ncbi:MAG: hypothetical protein M3N19_12020 [Candidatus Eremiobacteraeota bacterium]|nr:hypothetical protein [Candidatus Eremiobacteraeota bacterium]
MRPSASAILSCALILGALAGSPARAATVTGSLAKASVVWITQRTQPRSAEAERRNRDRTFNPGLIVIAAGTSVRFPNDDPYFHSIYTVSTPDPFDIGYYGNGPGKLVLFSSPGVIDVHCHIHPTMHGVIIVVDGPSTSGPVNTFSLGGVSPGNHSLHIWNESTGERSMDVVIPAQKSSVDLGKFK